ncbi:MAG: malonyl-CoA/methylmalonyl-CoA synthetase [Thermodesulfobacteriota bacterium]|nr:malonyl-CoA/methylmalonyl-CoA synthetase [Thermodesulfobacteriota bacterium]
MNLAGVISEVARRYGDKPAIVFENTTYTYNDLDRQVRHYSALLVRLGVRRGDRVAIQLPKRIEFIFLELAVMSVGGVMLPLNTDYQAEEIRYFLSDSGSRLFFTDGRRFERSQEVLGTLRQVITVVVDPTDGATSMGLKTELDNTDPNFERVYPAAGDDLAAILYTSGTTGKSKGAMLSHTNLISNMKALHEIWDWSDRDILLHVLPLFHVHGLFVALHGGLYAGATIIMHERFDPVKTWETIEKEKCTVLMGVPTIYRRLLNQWQLSEPKADLSSMRVFICGSAPLLETLFNRFEQATSFRILERYGMTEAVMVASNPIEPTGRKAKSVGYALPGVEIRIVSNRDEDVVPGQVGEVWVRGDNVFQGYWQMSEKTAESFEDKWFKTGDLGFQDPLDGRRLFIVGRSKELIISGGENVYPKEIEDVLESHHAVKEAAVVGLPDDDFGEKVSAFVVMNTDDKTSPDDLILFCKERLAGYKCPKMVVMMDALPRNAMGKIQKNELVEKFSGANHS